MGNTICPAECANFELTPVKEESCDLKERLRTLRSIGFYKCDVTIPDPVTCTALETLVNPASPAKPAIVFSNPLANVAWEDPTIVERKIADQYPQLSVVTQRRVTFQDRISVPKANNIFTDLDFWKNKQEFSTRLNYFFVFSDGGIVIPREQNSLVGMSAVLNVYRNFELVDTGGGIEFKVGSLTFMGDPLGLNQDDFNLNDCPDLAGLW